MMRAKGQWEDVTSNWKAHEGNAGQLLSGEVQGEVQESGGGTMIARRNRGEDLSSCSRRASQIPRRACPFVQPSASRTELLEGPASLCSPPATKTHQCRAPIFVLYWDRSVDFH
jgi:hypothetical protein